MKNSILLFVLLLLTDITAQVTNQGQPVSWMYNNAPFVPAVYMEVIDLRELHEQDVVNDVLVSVPWRFGKEMDVVLNLQNSGVWHNLPNGDRIWRIKIVSPGAHTLNFIFDDYYLPEGASLYIYNDDRSDLLGAYTAALNRKDRQLGTWMIEGETVWLEYYEPKSFKDKGVLQISKVVHGYRSVIKKLATERQLNSSGDCNLDVECSIGSDFDILKEELKRSVGLFLMGGSVCTGTLINNTENNNAPYFLTSKHCDTGNPGAWAFRFNWISPNPSCGTSVNSVDTPITNTTSGATVLASGELTDFMLVNIDGVLPPSWNLTWAGWNRSTTDIPQFTVGIHHPSGDIMKICRSDNPPIRTTLQFQENMEAQVWQIPFWNKGVTEGGSSGSALFDHNGRIIGQLAAGASGCEGLINNNQPDFYGRFDTSWDRGTTDDTRLSDWLDPLGTGAMTSDILDIPNFEFSGSLAIYPNPASSLIYIMNNNSPDLNYQFFSVTGQTVQSGKLQFANNTIAVDSLAEGVYFLQLIDKVSSNSLVKRVVIKKQ